MARVLGLGTTVGVDDDDSGSTYTTRLLMSEVTPPPRSRVRVSGVALGDTLATDGMGIEDVSDFKYTHFYDPGATNDVIDETLFASKNPILFQITFADAGTMTFEGQYVSVVPLPITHDKFVMREVTIQRTGSITFA